MVVALVLLLHSEGASYPVALARHQDQGQDQGCPVHASASSSPAQAQDQDRAAQASATSSPEATTHPPQQPGRGPSPSPSPADPPRHSPAALASADLAVAAVVAEDRRIHQDPELRRIQAWAAASSRRSSHHQVAAAGLACCSGPRNCQASEGARPCPSPYPKAQPQPQQQQAPKAVDADQTRSRAARPAAVAMVVVSEEQQAEGVAATSPVQTPVQRPKMEEEEGGARLRQQQQLYDSMSDSIAPSQGSHSNSRPVSADSTPNSSSATCLHRHLPPHPHSHRARVQVRRPPPSSSHPTRHPPTLSADPAHDSAVSATNCANAESELPQQQQPVPAAAWPPRPKVSSRGAGSSADYPQACGRAAARSHSSYSATTRRPD